MVEMRGGQAPGGRGLRGGGGGGAATTPGPGRAARAGRGAVGPEAGGGCLQPLANSGPRPRGARAFWERPV